MTFTTHKKKIVIYKLVWVMILCSFLLMGATAWEKAKALNLRNSIDSFALIMPFIELEAESGGRFGSRYTEAQKSHAEMIQKYVGHMNTRNRDLSFLFRLPPFSKKNIAKRLEEIARDLKEKVSSEDEARQKIQHAADSIAQIVIESSLFMGETVITFESEVISEEIQDAIRDSLEKAHVNTEIYAKDPTVAKSEDACMSNRSAIVYLYLARFGYDEFIGEEELKQFRTDINRTIFYNRILQQDEAVKAQHANARQAGKGVGITDYLILEKHSDSEILRLRLLQTIIDKDVQESQNLLRIATQKAIPEIQFQSIPPYYFHPS